MRALLWLLLAVAAMGTASDDGAMGGAEGMKPSDVGARDQSAAGLVWSMRARGQAAAQDACEDLPCDVSTAPADESRPPSSPEPPDDAAGRKQSPDADVRAAAEDAAEKRSLFAKIVDLVTPPSASQPAADGTYGQADHGAQNVDSVANTSDGGGNSTSKAPPREQHAHERAQLNTTKDGAAASASDAGADLPEVEVDVERDEQDSVAQDLLEPVYIGPDIFAELIPSIQGAGDPCTGNCTVNTCSGHGVCTGSLCQCNCSAQYTGYYCHERVAPITHFSITPPKKPCPDNCTGQGDCLSNGTCNCNKGWAGYNCSIECMGGAANPCSGVCVCVCCVCVCV